jgi:hypothetical protein
LPGRNEADAIPIVLTAPKSPIIPGEEDSEEAIYNAGFKDTRGYYEDGAYIATPLIGPVLPSDHAYDHNDEEYNEEDWDEGYDDGNDEYDGDDDYEEHHFPRSVTPLEAYTKSLLSRFHTQRTILHASPPATAVQGLDFTKCLILPKDERKHFNAWCRAIESIDPSPVQLSTMKNETVIVLIQMATRSMRRNTNVPQRFSAWVWGLLVRLDERTLDGSDVSTLRSLGLRAAWMRLGFVKEMAEASEGMCGNIQDDEEEETEHDEATVGAQAESEDEGEIQDDGRTAEEWQRGRSNRANEGLKRRRNTSSPSPRAPKRSHNVSSSSPHHQSSHAPKSNGDSTYHHDEVGTGRSHNASSFPHDTAVPLESVQRHVIEHSQGEHHASIEAAKARLLAKFARPAPTVDGGELDGGDRGKGGGGGGEGSLPDFNTVVTLDMIITIVGEVFGQRDLLEARALWENVAS